MFGHPRPSRTNTGSESDGGDDGGGGAEGGAGNGSEDDDDMSTRAAILRYCSSVRVERLLQSMLTLRDSEAVRECHLLL